MKILLCAIIGVDSLVRRFNSRKKLTIEFDLITRDEWRLPVRTILTFRTSALDYPRISFGAKLRGAVRYRRSSARWLDAVTERQLP